MRKKLIIACESSNLYTAKRFLTEGQSLKLNTVCLNPYEQSLLIKKDLHKSYHDSLYLFRTSGVRNDDFDLLLANHYATWGSQISNPLHALEIFRTKDKQQLFYHKHNLPFISTYIYRGALDDARKMELKKLSPSQDFIIKMYRGNGGIGVQIIHGLDSLFSALETFEAIRDQRILIQPFCPHNKEYRILCSKNKIYALIQKNKFADDFRGNSKRSSGKSLKKIPANLIDLTQKVLETSQLDYAGIDVIESHDQIQILEVNSVPGFKQVEELTKLNIARELLIDILHN